MGEMKGALISIVLFIGLIVPGLLQFGIDALYQHGFMKVTAEIGELVKKEGGVSEEVKDTVGKYEARGYEIDFNGVTGLVNYGETVTIDYSLTYRSVFNERELKTKNKVLILKRNGSNVGLGDDDGNSSGTTKTITVESNQLVNNHDHTQTFRVPGLKNVKELVVDTGVAEVVEVEGEYVTIRMKNGTPVKQEKKDDGTPEQTKYIEEYDSPYYNEDGYKGTLEKYLSSGSYVPGETKYIESYNSPNYNVGGFKGTLEKYLVGGNYISPDSKYASDSRISNYNSFPSSIYYEENGSNGRYSGSLTKNGSPSKRQTGGTYIPGDTKWVDGQSSAYYNKDGYTGTLERVQSGGSYVPGDSKYVTGQTSPYYSDGDGYSGTLTAYTESVYVPGETEYYRGQDYYGDPTPRSPNVFPVIKTINYPGNDKKQAVESAIRQLILEVATYHGYDDYDNDFEFAINQWGSVYNVPVFMTVAEMSTAFHAVYGDLYEINYNRNGYSGQLEYYKNYKWSGLSRWHTVTVDGKNYDFDVYYALYSGPLITAGHYETKTLYQGYVTKAGSDNREYSYEGWVTKDAVDTRTYEYTQYYSGTIYRPESDTRIYKYRGIVEKPLYDTRVFKYRGYVTKPATEGSGEYDNYYKYKLTITYQ